MGKFDKDFDTSLTSVPNMCSGSFVVCSGVFLCSLLKLGFGSLNSK